MGAAAQALLMLAMACGLLACAPRPAHPAPPRYIEMSPIPNPPLPAPARGKAAPIPPVPPQKPTPPMPAAAPPQALPAQPMPGKTAHDLNKMELPEALWLKARNIEHR